MINLATPETAADFMDLAGLARKLAAHHGDDFNPAAADFARDHGPWFGAVIARSEPGQSIGFAGWHRIYILQKAERGLDLQNLYVEAEWRACGVGRQLVVHVAALALRQECSMVRIGVRKDNTVAVAFYRRLGFELSDRGSNWGCRLDRAGMRELTCSRS